MNEETEPTIKIDRNIPIPNTFERGMGCRVTGVVRKLKVGESFVLNKARRVAAISAARNIGVKVTTRSISETEIRVWRIK